MSDFQLIVGLTGAGLIVVLILFNRWQERRYMKQSMRHLFDNPKEDVLINEINLDQQYISTPKTNTQQQRDDIIPFIRSTSATDIGDSPDPADLANYMKAFANSGSFEVYDKPHATTQPSPIQKPAPVPVEPSVPAQNINTEIESAETARHLESVAPASWQPSANRAKMAPASEHTSSYALEHHTKKSSEYTPVAIQTARREIAPPEDFSIPDIPSLQPNRAEEATVIPASPPEEKPPITPLRVNTTQSEWPVLPPSVSELIDSIALLRFEKPIKKSDLLQKLDLLRVISKPVACFGVDAQGYTYDLSNRAVEVQIYHGLICTLQLANREGAVSQREINVFEEIVNSYVQYFNARIKWLIPLSPISYAKMLDEFCITVDITVSLHIVQSDGVLFSGTKLRGLFDACHFYEHKQGHYAFKNAIGEILFTVKSIDGRAFNLRAIPPTFYSGISFFLEISKVENFIEVFDEMVQIAYTLKVGLNGRLIDDNQSVIGPNDIGKIRRHLEEIAQQMTARNILPGSITAQRLFS